MKIAQIFLAVAAVALVEARSRAQPTPAEILRDWPDGVRHAPRGFVDAPRWRARMGLSVGSGGVLGPGGVAAAFPARVELGVRLWRILSLSAEVNTALMTAHERCPLLPRGDGAPAHAYGGALGLRVDAWNGKASSWAVPFVEAHVGVGGQTRCDDNFTFATGGVRAGLDAWLGRSAVSIALGYDYLPVRAPISLSLGLTILLY